MTLEPTSILPLGQLLLATPKYPMTSLKNPLATKWTATSVLTLAALTSCATTPYDATATVAPYFASRDAVVPIASTSITSLASHATTPAFARGHFATKSTLREVAPDKQPRGMAFVRTAVGMEEVQVLSGTDFKNDTDAGMLEIAFEGTGKVMGGGLRFGARATDDDFLESSAAVDTQGEGAHFFGHLTIRPGGRRFRMPIRIGPEILANAFLLDASPFGSIAELDFVSVGGAVEIEPEFDIFRSERSALSIYGRAHVGAGVAQISSDTTDYDTDSTNIGAELGVRWQLKKFLLSGGYMLKRTEYAESDPENFATIQETIWQFEGFFLTLGVRW